MAVQAPTQSEAVTLAVWSFLDCTSLPGSALTPTLGYLSLMMTILSSAKSCSLGSSIATFKPAFQKGVRLGLIQSLSHVRSLCFAITDDTAGGRENCTVPALSRHYTANTRIRNSKCSERHRTTACLAFSAFRLHNNLVGLDG